MLGFLSSGVFAATMAMAMEGSACVRAREDLRSRAGRRWLSGGWMFGGLCVGW